MCIIKFQLLFHRLTIFYISDVVHFVTVFKDLPITKYFQTSADWFRTAVELMFR